MNGALVTEKRLMSKSKFIIFTRKKWCVEQNFLRRREFKFLLVGEICRIINNQLWIVQLVVHHTINLINEQLNCRALLI